MIFFQIQIDIFENTDYNYYNNNVTYKLYFYSIVIVNNVF